MTNKMVGIWIRLLGVVCFCLLLLFVFMETRHFCYDIFADEAYRTKAQVEKNVEIEVKEGESLSDIAKDLEKKDVIKSSFKFKLTLKFMDGSDQIKPGTYSVNAAMRPSEILNILAHQEEF